MQTEGRRTADGVVVHLRLKVEGERRRHLFVVRRRVVRMSISFSPQFLSRHQIARAVSVWQYIHLRKCSEILHGATWKQLI